MASSKFEVVPIVLVLLLVVKFGSSLNCYNCTEATNKNCKDTFHKEHVSKIQCPDSLVCIKHKQPGIVAETPEKTANISATIIRGCKPKKYCQTVEKFAEHCSSCTTELCNSSSPIMPSVILVTLYVAKNIFL